MTHRVTQLVAETLADPAPTHAARVTQIAAETLTSPDPLRTARVTQIIVEVMYGTNPAVASGGALHMYVHS